MSDGKEAKFCFFDEMRPIVYDEFVIPRVLIVNTKYDSNFIKREQDNEQTASED